MANWTYLIIGFILMVFGSWIAFFHDWGTLIQFGEFFRLGVETLIGGIIAGIGVIFGMAGLTPD